MTTIDRWRENRPLSESEYRRAWDALFLACLYWGFWLTIACLGLAAAIGCRTAEASDGYQRSGETAYVFVPSGGCLYCTMLKQDIQSGQLGQYNFQFIVWDKTSGQWNRPDVIAEFFRAFPKANSKQGFPGWPFVWIDGAKSYHIGYSHEKEHKDQLKHYLAINSGYAPQYRDPKVPIGFDGPSTPAANVPDVPDTQPVKTETIAIDGVIIVALVSSLTDKYQTGRQIVASMARESLNRIVAEQLGYTVSAHLIAEVEDPDRYARLVNLTMRTPSPVLIHVLIPQRLQGFQGMIIGRVAKAIEAHYLESIQKSPINPIIERLHAELHEAIVMELQRPPDSQPAPEWSLNAVLMLVAAWFAERTKIGRLIVERFLPQKEAIS